MTNEILYVYKFNNSSVDLLPTFNAEFTNYTYEDVVDGTTTTRTISSTERPTSVSFMSKTNLLEVHKLYTTGMDSLYGAFYKCSKLTYVDLSYSDFSATTTLEGLFNSCSKLASIDGLDTLDVSNVENMGGLFSGCSALTELNINNWDVGKNTNFGATFRGCSKLTNLDLSKWRARSAARMGGMFQQCSKLVYLDLSGIDVSTVLTGSSASPSQLFYGCTSLAELDLSGWKINPNSELLSVFANCSSLKTIKLFDSNISTINKLIQLLPTKTEDNYGLLRIAGIENIDSVDKGSALSKYWNCNFGVKNFVLDNSRVQKFYLGDKRIKKAYLGDDLLFDTIYHSPSSSIQEDAIKFNVEEITHFEGGENDYINTGVDLFTGGNDWSMMIDFTDSGYTEWYESLFILHNFYEGENNELYGFNIQKTGSAQGSRLSFQVNDNYYPTKTLNNGDNTRLVLVFHYPNELHMYYNDTELGSHLSDTGHYIFPYDNYHSLDDCTLHLACWYNKVQGGAGRFWRGMLNEFIIWEGVKLTDEEIQLVLNTKKEHVTLPYTVKTNYTPNGSSFRDDIIIDWDAQEIYASVDLSTCTGDVECILSIGDNIDTWAGQNIHFYYIKDTGRMLIQCMQGGSAQNIELNIQDSMDIRFGIDGLVVNDTLYPTSEYATFSNLLNSSLLQIGSTEGSTRSTASNYNISVRNVQRRELLL